MEEKKSTPDDTPATGGGSTIELSANTRLQDLFKVYPKLRQDLPSMNPAFKMLNSPLARVIVPKATIAMMSERSGIPIDRILFMLKALIAKYKLGIS